MTAPAVVFDCVIFLQALVNELGPAGACWKSVKDGRLILFTSEPILAELSDVLQRPKIAAKLGTTSEIASAYLDEIRQVSVVLAAVPTVFAFPRDPKDEPYLNLAIAAAVSYLVTRDLDMLNLATPDSADGQRFRLVAPQAAIVDPVQLLTKIGEKST